MIIKFMKLFVLISFIAINCLIITSCSSKKDEKSSKIQIVNEDHVELEQKNANVLSFENKTSIKISKSDSNFIKIKNIAKFPISNVNIKYVELDKNNDILVKSMETLDMTLNSDEGAYLYFDYRDFSESIDVIGYSYEYGDKAVSLDLKTNNIKIYQNDKELDNSNKYEVLTISDANKIGESKDAITYSMKIKNNSKNDLGNTILNIAELNENNEYIKLLPVVYNTILKSQEEALINVSTSKDAYKLEVVGYTYDDIKTKSNISLDLKSHLAQINK